MNQQLESIKYLQAIIRTYSISAEEKSTLVARSRLLLKDIRIWSKEILSQNVDIHNSGSFEKGTAVVGTVDIDFLISFKNHGTPSLKEIYESLYNYLTGKYETRKQNVSIGVNFNQIKIDIVPAKQWVNEKHKHSLYVRKADTWKMTNIDSHINAVKNTSEPIRNIIKLMKIWRNLHKVEFPSFLIELVVLEVLNGKIIRRSFDNGFLQVLSYLQKDFCGARIVDPANSNNIVSDTISASEKDTIKKLANKSLKADCWEQIVWGLYPIIRS